MSAHPHPAHPMRDPSGTRPAAGPRRTRLWRIIFLSDTPAGRAFDFILLWVIAASVLTVVLQSVEELRSGHQTLFQTAEWGFTLLFTLEYIVRLAVVRQPWRYASSFFGVVDLLAILPTYLELVLAGSHYLMVLRVLRLLRMFRVLKMGRHLSEADVLLHALQASRAKISVFFFGIMALVCIEGTLMYLLEHTVNPGFRNIPQSIYWAILTLTTVGSPDAAPLTFPGKMTASVIVLTGFAILAVPTGVVSAELGRKMARSPRGRAHCPACGWDEHDFRARFCQQCGGPLP
jgi:voltage-gated potassium channel